MRFTAQEEYGLRCMVQMALHEGPGVVTIDRIAKAESLTPEHVAKLMRILRQAGLVQSIRGQSGGYVLARPAPKMTVAQILTALGGELFSGEHCDRFSGTVSLCVHTTDCSLRSLWTGIHDLLEKHLGSITLQDLTTGGQTIKDMFSARPMVSSPVPTPLPIASASTTSSGCGSAGCGSTGCGESATNVVTMSRKA